MTARTYKYDPNHDENESYYYQKWPQMMQQITRTNTKFTKYDKTFAKITKI